jgi:hypothetical protein
MLEKFGALGQLIYIRLLYTDLRLKKPRSRIQAKNLNLRQVLSAAK